MNENCRNCAMLEVFGTEGINEFWNKCALLDIYNLDPNDAEPCEYFQPVKKYSD